MVLTADMIAPITTTLTANMEVLVPVGLAVMSAMIGISLIPKIIYKFI
ncbi:MAG: hypothetical protein R3Y12_07875 [Clostridia bacterium]